MIHYDPTGHGFDEFFIYTSCHWLEHFGTIIVEPLPNLTSITNLCQAGLTWLHNWIQQNCHQRCVITPRFQFYSSLYDLLSITLLYGSEAMLHDMLKNLNFDKKFLQKPAMKATDQVLQWGNVSRLRILFLDDKLDHQLQNLDFFWLIIRRWSDPIINHYNWDLVFDLIKYVSYKLIQEHWGNELLCMAARAGCMPIVRWLINSAQHKAELRGELLREFWFEQQSMFGKPTHQSIGEAVLRNHIDVVEYLLGENDINTHLWYWNFCGENVLHLTSRRCNLEMFCLLIPCFQKDIHQTDNQGDTALVWIIMNPSASHNWYELARILLLQTGINWNSHSWDGQQNPLQAAVQLDDLDMCCLLICVGNMSPHSALTFDSEGQMDLKDRSSEKKEEYASDFAISMCTCQYSFDIDSMLDQLVIHY